MIGRLANLFGAIAAVLLGWSILESLFPTTIRLLNGRVRRSLGDMDGHLYDRVSAHYRRKDKDCAEAQ